MQTVNLLTNPWYGDDVLPLRFPDSWDVHTVELPERAPLTDEQIAAAFQSPVGADAIVDLAREHSSAVILVDDITRPTPTQRVVPHILRQLRQGGIAEDSLAIVVASGTHRPLTRIDLLKKLGEEVVNTVQVLRHDVNKGLVYLGKTALGTPIYINESVMQFDLKIGTGGIYHHWGCMFGGGPKIVTPGVAGEETILHNHGLCPVAEGGSGASEMERNMNEIAARVGLKVVANAVVNGRREIVALFVGDYIRARQAAVQYAKEFLAVDPVEEAEVVVSNAYPFDVNLVESAKALWPFETVKKGGTKVLVSSSPEGMGLHFHTPDTPSPAARNSLERAEFALFSPTAGLREAGIRFPNCAFFSDWGQLISELVQRHGRTGVRAAVYACASLQIWRKNLA